MSDIDEDDLWQVRRSEASYDFAHQCRELTDSDPFTKTEGWEPVIIQIVTHLFTELWDRGFSQTEIDTAFKIASDRLQRYSAGMDRRS